MYWLLKITCPDKIGIITHSIGKPLLTTDFCSSCLRCKSEQLKGRARFHTSRCDQAQYISALKHLLNKKTKKGKKKSKKYVEVLKATENSVVNSLAAVDTLSGRQLAALTNHLTQNTTIGSHTSVRSHFTDTTRHYDPLAILPTDSRNDPVIDKQGTYPNVLRSKPDTFNKHAGLLKFSLNNTPSIYVPDLMRHIRRSMENGETVTNIKILRKPNSLELEIAPIEENNSKLVEKIKLSDIGGNVAEKNLRKELRRKLRLHPVYSVNEAELLDDVVSENISTVDPRPINDGSLIPLDDSDIRVPNEETKVPLKAASAGKAKSKSRASYNVSLKKTTREAIAKQRISDLEKNSKIESLNANFLSYVDVCVNNNMVNDALSTVKAFRRKIEQTRDWVPRLNNIEIYNTILQGFAREGNWKKVTELLTCASEDGLTYNEGTYAAILDCLGRARKKSAHLISNYLNEMKEKGIKLNNLFSICPLQKDSFENIMEAIKIVDPDFTPQPLCLDKTYHSPLLTSLNDTSHTFSSPAPKDLTFKQLQSLFHEQLEVEMKNSVKIKTVEKRTEEMDNVQFYRDKLEEAKQHWVVTTEAALKRDLEVLKSQSRHKSYFFFSIYPYLMALPQSEYVEIILQEIRKLAEGSETYSPTTRQLYRELGTQVCLRYQIRKKTENGSLELLQSLFTKYLEWYLHPVGNSTNTRQHWQQLLHESNAAAILGSGEAMWRSHVLIGVGRFLYNIIIRDVKIDVNAVRAGSTKPHYLPAFYTLFRNKGHISKEEVKPHPILSRLFRASAQEDLIFDALMIPMSCPPLPWSSITSGGYLVTKADLIRLPFQAVAQWKTLAKTPANNLYPAFDSLNQLGSIPWTVNEQVLDVILEVFNNGGSSKLDVPEPPSSCPGPDPVTPDMSPQERYDAYRQRLAVRRRRAEMYSLWCDALYKLSLANHFRKRMFWLPHNMDFRGRVYPVAPHLNHLGSDLSRSLLVFAKGEPLGSEGFDWLKIHAINLAGTHKKKSIQSRLEYANEILDDILDSAENPLTGRMWWTTSEEPWQTLATCMEISKAVKSGDPTSFVSHFPVHQDGSCNGLQHYAALGRDQAGGESVNLTPASVPQDVYSCIVAIVERERAKDAANGVKIAQLLEGFVFRKVIKQTVMTTVYGVTRFGARLQIARQLKDLNDFPKEHVWAASMYLVSKTFDSLQEMFTSTKEIQDWFTECARLIAQVCGENVEWVTPLGLPIVQPYSRPASITSADHIKFIGVQSGTHCDAFERPNIMKQKNAFAPNFIHSLDSSHMMLTSLFCERAGLTFVSVHDCYWTHASTVAAMNRCCREQFVAMHSQPILRDLSNYFIQRFAYDEATIVNDGSVGDMAKRNLNRALRALPGTGSLDLHNVLHSPYFFS